MICRISALRWALSDNLRHHLLLRYDLAGLDRGTGARELMQGVEPDRGIFLQGGAPGHVLYCAHWMEQHPSFSETGLVTVAYYDRGRDNISRNSTHAVASLMVTAWGRRLLINRSSASTPT